MDHESAGIQNIFGADWGTPGVDRVPFAHLPVTKERVAALVAYIRAGGVSNGVGLTQLTWRDFIYQAEALGGAHLPRYQCRVGFGILAGYLDSSPDYLTAIGKYNGGPSNPVYSYAQKVAGLHATWKSRLA